MNSLPVVTPPSLVEVAPAGPVDPAGDAGDFHVHLTNFSGPFDLLLSLIAKHKLDITEVALSRVTDEFISYIRFADFTGESQDALVARDERRNLGLASEFLLVAATLLDLKAARLLPTGEADDQDAIELLEARDLLFAKLLQYRAFKQLAQEFADRLEVQSEHVPRAAALEGELAALLPPLVWNLSPESLAQLARRALGAPEAAPPPPHVTVTHLHSSAIAVTDEAPCVLALLRGRGTVTFTELTEHSIDPLVHVVRFLILLELFRDHQIEFTQSAPLEPLHITWVGTADYRAYVLSSYAGTSDSEVTPPWT